jgi:hypothetical protein
MNLQLSIKELEAALLFFLIAGIIIAGLLGIVVGNEKSAKKELDRTDKDTLDKFDI